MGTARNLLLLAAKVLVFSVASIVVVGFAIYFSICSYVSDLVINRSTPYRSAPQQQY
jgi:hypothetical protein